MQGADFLNSTVVTLGTAATTITPRNVWVDYIALCNTDSSDRTFTITDGNTKYLYKAVTVKTGGEPFHVPLPEGGLLFSGGVQISASVADVVDCWVRFRSV